MEPSAAAVSPARRSLGWLPWTALVVLYLIYREVISLGHICPYCTSVHVITFLLFGLLTWDATGPGLARPAAAGEAGHGD